MNAFFKYCFLCLSFIFIMYIFEGCSNEPDAPTPPGGNSEAVQSMKPLNAIPKGERIIFVRKEIKRIWIVDDSIDVGTGNIWSMAPDGTNQLQHTNLSKDFFVTNNPKLSNNGRYLTFTSNYKSWLSSSYTDIFKWDMTTNKIVRVSGDEWPEETPPTNYVTLKVLSVNQNVRISAKGCQNFVFPQTEVTVDNVTYFRTYLKVPASTNIWIKAEKSASFGDLVFNYMSGTGSNEVVLGPLRSDGGDGYVSVVSNGHSNDNGKVVAMINGKLAMWKENGSLIWEKNIGGHSWGISDDPVWSHDGTKIALSLGVKTYSNAIAILNPPESVEAPEPIIGDPLGVEIYLGPSWSPDDTKILFSFCMVGGQGIVPNIFMMPVSGGNPTQLTNYSGYYAAVNPCYSPDGTKIAFTLLKCRNTSFQDYQDFNLPTNIESANIYVMNADGSNVTQLTTDGMSYCPYWGTVQ